MSDKKIAEIMRDFVKTMAEGDIEKISSFFTKDGEFTCPMGTFRGEWEIKNYMKLQSEQMQNMKVTESGNGIIVEKNKAFFEHVISGIYQGKRVEVLAICAYEFTDDKIQKVRSTFDRLLMAKQAAPGWLAKTMVNSIVNKMEAGLH